MSISDKAAHRLVHQHWLMYRIRCERFADLAGSRDLQQRGMLEKTLVVTFGEFGRTPYINKERGGRDHWSKCFSLSLAGGGLKSGAIIGTSDKFGEQPRTRKLTVPDLAATIYHALGMNPHSEFTGNDGRPMMALPEGQPIRELV